MKQVIIIIGFVVVMMLVFLTLLSVQGRTDRRDELDRAVAFSGFSI